MVEFEMTINHADGIHARPAGQLVKAAQKCKSAISLNKAGKSADLKRLFSILGLNVKQGTVVTVTVEGEGEEAEAAELKAFMEENFA